MDKHFVSAFSKRILPLFLAVFMVFNSSIVSYAAVYDYEIPASPSVSETDYPYWIIFRGTSYYSNKAYVCYYLIFQKSQFYYANSFYYCTEELVRYVWTPVKSDSWGNGIVYSNAGYSSSLFTYVSSNYDIMSSDAVYHAKRGSSAFLNDLAEQFSDYSFDSSVWEDTRRVDASGSSGGSSFDDSGILAGIRNIVQAIKNIPSAILDGLKDLLLYLFIPSEDYFTNEIDRLRACLEEVLPVTAVMTIVENIKTASAGDMPNVEIDYMGVHATIVNFDFFREYKPTINSWVRGFMFVLLAFYWLDQIYKLLRGTTLYSGSGGGSSSTALTVVPTSELSTRNRF